MKWEIANPVSAEAVAQLLSRPEVRATGVIVITLDSDDPELVRAVEESAAEWGLVLIRVEDEP